MGCERLTSLSADVLQVLRLPIAASKIRLPLSKAELISICFTDPLHVTNLLAHHSNSHHEDSSKWKYLQLLQLATAGLSKPPRSAPNVWILCQSPVPVMRCPTRSPPTLILLTRAQFASATNTVKAGLMETYLPEDSNLIKCLLSGVYDGGLCVELLYVLDRKLFCASDSSHLPPAKRGCGRRKGKSSRWNKTLPNRK